MITSKGYGKTPGMFIRSCNTSFLYCISFITVRLRSRVHNTHQTLASVGESSICMCIREAKKNGIEQEGERNGQGNARGEGKRTGMERKVKGREGVVCWQ